MRFFDSCLLLLVTSSLVRVVSGAHHGPRGMASSPKQQAEHAEHQVRLLQDDQCEICSKENKDNKPTTLVLEYIPAGKDSQFQGDKASCRARMYPTSTSIEVDGTTFNNVAQGDRITLTADNKFDANTDFDFGDGTSCSIHTSCSVPLV